MVSGAIRLKWLSMEPWRGFDVNVIPPPIDPIETMDDRRIEFILVCRGNELVLQNKSAVFNF